jgi:hypothetical protein
MHGGNGQSSSPSWTSPALFWCPGLLSCCPCGTWPMCAGLRRLGSTCGCARLTCDPGRPPRAPYQQDARGRTLQKGPAAPAAKAGPLPPTGEDEVEEGPELGEAVLDGRAAHDQAVHGAQLLGHQRDLKGAAGGGFGAVHSAAQAAAPASSQAQPQAHLPCRASVPLARPFGLAAIFGSALPPPPPPQPPTHPSQPPHALIIPQPPTSLSGLRILWPSSRMAAPQRTGSSRSLCAAQRRAVGVLGGASHQRPHQQRSWTAGCPLQPLPPPSLLLLLLRWSSHSAKRQSSVPPTHTHIPPPPTPRAPVDAHLVVRGQHHARAALHRQVHQRLPSGPGPGRGRAARGLVQHHHLRRRRRAALWATGRTWPPGPSGARQGHLATRGI